MSSEFQERVNLAKRYDDLRRGGAAPALEEGAVELVEAPPEAYSHLSPDRQQKLMIELRLLNGSAKALAYSYLVAVDFDPAKVSLDFSGYRVTLAGRNLRPLFEGLVYQRVARVQEIDPVHAEALPETDTAVTHIDVEERRG